MSTFKADWYQKGLIDKWTGNPNQEVYFVVRKGFEHPELLVKLKSLTLDYNQGDAAYTDNSPEAIEYMEWVNHEYGIEFIGGFDWYDAVARSYTHIKEAIEDTWVGVETMPKLNYGSQKLRDIIYRKKDSVLKKWLLPPYDIDGWRFDVAECLARNQVIDVHGEVLEELRVHLKEEKKDVFLLAEDWVDCSDDLQGNRWDSTMNYYGCARPVREFVGETDLFLARDKELGKNRSKMTISDSDYI